MKIRNKKGFTMVEIIATLSILAVILIIAVPSYNKLQEKFKDDFYKNEENTLLLAGKEYFSNNKNALPKEYLQDKKVTLKTLKDNNQLDDTIKKYNSTNECSSDSYVIVVKDKDKYEYKACLDCGEGEYITPGMTNTSTEKDEENGKPLNYCNTDFKGTPIIETKTSGNILKYLYVGKYSLQDLREELAIQKEVSRVPFKTIQLDKKYYPTTINGIKTDVIGTYTLNYDDVQGIDSAELIVYQHDAPILKLKNAEVADNASIDMENSDSINLSYNETKFYKNTDSENFPYPSIFDRYEVKKTGSTTWETISESSYKPSISGSYKFRVVGRNIDDNKFSKYGYENGKEVEITINVKNSYEITYDKNTTDPSASGTMETTICSLGTSCSLRENKFTRNGYEFDGWNTKSDGSGTNYYDKDTVEFSADTTLYAKWKIKVVSLNFDLNGGTGGTTIIYQKYGVGLFKDKAATQKFYDSEFKTPTYNNYELDKLVYSYSNEEFDYDLTRGGKYNYTTDQYFKYIWREKEFNLVANDGVYNEIYSNSSFKTNTLVNYSGVLNFITGVQSVVLSIKDGNSTYTRNCSIDSNPDFYTHFTRFDSNIHDRYYCGYYTHSNNSENSTKTDYVSLKITYEENGITKTKTINFQINIVNSAICPTVSPTILPKNGYYSTNNNDNRLGLYVTPHSSTNTWYWYTDGISGQTIDLKRNNISYHLYNTFSGTSATVQKYLTLTDVGKGYRDYLIKVIDNNGNTNYCPGSYKMDSGYPVITGNSMVVTQYNGTTIYKGPTQITCGNVSNPFIMKRVDAQVSANNQFVAYDTISGLESFTYNSTLYSNITNKEISIYDCRAETGHTSCYWKFIFTAKDYAGNETSKECRIYLKYE